MRRISMSMHNSMDYYYSILDESIKRHAKTECRSRRRIGSLPSPLRTYCQTHLCSTACAVAVTT